VLGIFGREGLDLATLWSPPTATQPGAFAFRMYLNYDGLGGSFGDVGVRATSADQSKLAVYAADRTADGAKTFMVVNKTGDDLTSTMSVGSGTTPLGSRAQVWRYSSANLSAIAHEADVPILVPPPTFPPGPSAISTTFPANSITLLVVPGDGSPPTRPGPAVASNITSSGFTLTWAPSTDNVGVTQYSIFATVQDVVWLATSTQPTYTFTNLPANTEFSVTIGARDAAGNNSLRSTPVNVRTLGLNAGGCTATYRITSSWPGNVQGEVTVTNTGTTTLTGWTVRWTFPSGVTISQLWNGTMVSGAASVVVRNAAWNGTLAPNQTATFGFLAAQSGSPTIPPVTCSSP
jgi:hypothetical protein